MRARLRFLGILLPIALPIAAGGLLIAAGGHAKAQVAIPDPEEFRLAVSVDLVEVHATVKDRDGRPVLNLLQENFEISEDGARQTIRLFRHEDTPVAVGLVVDHSGSVGRKLAQVVAAARVFVEASRAEDQMFVVNFNEHVSMGLPDKTPFTSHPDELAWAITHTETTGMTALYDAVLAAREHLRIASHDKKALIVVSDGGDNASTQTLDDVLKMARQSSIIIYAIGIFDRNDPDRNPDVLRRLARATGGEAYFPEELSDVVAIGERIAREIRTQYTLGYTSPGTAKPGSYRKIRVSVRAPEYGRLSVRAREGYIAGGEAPAQQEKVTK